VSLGDRLLEGDNDRAGGGQLRGVKEVWIRGLLGSVALCYASQDLRDVTLAIRVSVGVDSCAVSVA
jgi:hypothetical protein